jgi:hypothetical protein
VTVTAVRHTIVIGRTIAITIDRRRLIGECCPAVGLGPHVVDGGAEEQPPPSEPFGFRHRRNTCVHVPPTPSR